MRTFDCVSLQYFREEELLLWKIRDTGMPNFCLRGLREFAEFTNWVQEYFSHPDRPLKFIVSGSEHEGIYNMGGDLPFFLDCIASENQDQLSEYAHLCVDAIYAIYTAFGLPAMTLALVEGNAYGGGFECALAHDFMIAETQAQFCLPENKFNLFPGMGAHSLLSRKISRADAEKLIRSKKVYGADILESIGLIERVVAPGQGMHQLLECSKKLKEYFNFEYHHMQCKKMINPLSKRELLNITDVWVKACLKIDSFDLRKMEILSKAQARRKKEVLQHG